MQRENRWSKQIADSFRGLQEGAWAKKIHAGPMGNAGIPDLWLALEGLVVVAEVKVREALPVRGASMVLQPAGGASPCLSKLQLSTLLSAGNAGMRAGVFLGVEEERRLWWVSRETFLRDGATLDDLGGCHEVPRGQAGSPPWRLLSWWIGRDWSSAGSTEKGVA